MKDKTNRVPWQRISVSLPPLMLTDLKVKSRETGLSVSRLVYLRLRERGDIIIVPSSIRQELVRLQRLVDDAKDGHCIPAEVIEQLSDYTALVKQLLETGGINHA